MRKGSLFKILTNCLAFLLICFGGAIFGVTLALQNVSIEINGSTIYEILISDASEFSDMEFTYNSQDYTATVRVTGSGDVVVPEKVKYSGDEYTITHISDVAKRIKTIVVPATVTSVDGAFYTAFSLESVEFAEGSQLESIGSYAFEFCLLKSINIPSSMTSIGRHAFDYCNNLTSVIFENPNGWTAGSTALSSADLSNPEIAATFLKETYKSDTWTRA